MTPRALRTMTAASRHGRSTPRSRHAEITFSPLYRIHDRSTRRERPVNYTVGRIFVESCPRKAVCRSGWAEDLLVHRSLERVRGFLIYPSSVERILATRKVIVGTAYSTNPAFSGTDSSSRLVGHDIDLITVLVRGCLQPDYSKRRIAYDPAACNYAIRTYESSVHRAPRESHPPAST